MRFSRHMYNIFLGSTRRLENSGWISCLGTPSFLGTPVIPFPISRLDHLPGALGRKVEWMKFHVCIMCVFIDRKAIYSLQI